MNPLSPQLNPHVTHVDVAVDTAQDPHADPAFVRVHMGQTCCINFCNCPIHLNGVKIHAYVAETNSFGCTEWIFS